MTADAAPAPEFPASLEWLNLTDPLRMAQVIEQTRQELIDKGCTLEPWTMPFITDASAIPETTPNY